MSQQNLNNCIQNGLCSWTPLRTEGEGKNTTKSVVNIQGNVDNNYCTQLSGNQVKCHHMKNVLKINLTQMAAKIDSELLRKLA